MDDFSWDDFESDDDDLFGKPEKEDRADFFRKMNRLLFINDLEQYPSQVVPLGPEEFKDLFGNPNSEDLDIMTQLFLKDAHRIGGGNVIDKWGPEWIWELLQYNVDKEEYEICAVIRDIIEDSQDKLLRKYFKLQD